MLVVLVVLVVLSEQVFERTHVRFLAHPTDTYSHRVEHMFDFDALSGYSPVHRLGSAATAPQGVNARCERGTTARHDGTATHAGKAQKRGRHNRRTRSDERDDDGAPVDGWSTFASGH